MPKIIKWELPLEAGQMQGAGVWGTKPKH